MLDDSEDVRLFVELSSYVVDVVEARDAPERALLGMADANSTRRDAKRSLVANATMA